MIRRLLAATVAMASWSSGAMAAPVPAAQGGPVTCEASNVRASYGSMGLADAVACQNGANTNDFLNPLEVNAEAFFGFSDWTFVAKQEDAGLSGADIGLSITGLGELSGTWSIAAGSLAQYGELMVVLKAGTEFAGYRFTDLNTLGGAWGYSSPPGLSHLSIYARGTGAARQETPVPEPAALGLFAIGSLAFAAGRRRVARRREPV